MTVPRPEEEVIFSVARRLALAEERVAYVHRACGADETLQSRLEGLLRIHAENATFLETPPAGLTTTPEIAIGARVGDYILRDTLGEGGFSNVYLAESIRPPHDPVAVKILKPGLLSPQGAVRFAGEREALARMDHPNIARVLDSDEFAFGRPYIVMEYVRGLPITKHVERFQSPLESRLRLAIDVCDAVQHAHQKGVIHRDIKPSNVLVTMVDDVPVAKVIDFGVAKAIGEPLVEASLQTNVGQLVGTPLYMSPEQMDFKGDIDTRTDIYAIGALLYELLTGSPPFERGRLVAAGFDEMRRIVREEEPSRPSERRPELGAEYAGELDWIVMKCLEKDRTRRYASAGDMARDLRRYLANEPVEARPPNRAYKLRKWLGRNRAPVLAAAVLLLVLIGGIVGTSIGLVRAERSQKAAEADRQSADRQRDRAERHYQRALAAVDRLLTRVGTSGLAPIPHLDQTRRRLLEDAREFYQSLLAQEGDDPVLRHELGRAHGRIGQINMQLGQVDKSEQSIGKSIEILSGLVREFPDHDGYRSDLLEAYRKLAGAWQYSGRGVDAERLIRDVLNRESPRSLDSQRVHGGLQYMLGSVCRDLRRPAEAEVALKAALNLQESVLRVRPEDTNQEEARANTLNMFGILCREDQRLDESRQYFQTAHDVFERLIATDPADPDYQHRLAGVLNNLGLVAAAQGNLEKAEDAYRKSLILAERLVHDHPDLADFKRFLANTHNNLALLHAKAGDKPRALAENALSLKHHEELMRRFPQRIEFAVGFAGACGNQAKYLIEQQQWTESIPWNTKAIETLTEVVGAEPRRMDARMSLFNSLLGRAGAYRTLNQTAQATDDYRRAIELSKGERHPTFVTFRVRALAFVGEHAQASTEAEAIVSRDNATSANCKEMANVFANCAEVVIRDAGLGESERKDLAEHYAARSVALLGKAAEKGHFPTYERVVALRTDDRLRPVRDRDDFKRLVAELEEQRPRPPEKK